MTVLGVTIDVVPHAHLTEADVAALRRLFDAEYRREFGGWNPELPYGYAPHELHIIAWRGDQAVGHVGWARRRVSVGDEEVVISGVGGVLVADSARGEQLGQHLMHCAAESMKDAGGVAFGYLGCREDVAAFYTSCGWNRIHAAERSISRAGKPVLDPPGQPLLILPVEHGLENWPQGDIDLRGRAW